MAQLTTKPLSWFKANAQVRKTFDEAEFRLLGESLRHKQLQPVLAKPDGTIIAGEQRYGAAKMVEQAPKAAGTEFQDFSQIDRTQRKSRRRVSRDYQSRGASEGKRGQKWHS